MNRYKCSDIPSENNINRNCSGCFNCSNNHLPPFPQPRPGCEECPKQHQGNSTQCQGNQTQELGGQAQGQGDQIQTQGPQTETQGDLTEVQGALTQTQAAQTETQGDLTESLGDMSQFQGGETQGDQTQSMTGHGGQTQGPQSQGDQTLTSAPTISTPVTVSGVNVNVNVTCDGDCKKKPEDCKEQCKDTITKLLLVIKSLGFTIADKTASQISFYSIGLMPSPTVGNLGDISSNCTFSILPQSGGKYITLSTDTLEALSFTPASKTPNLFALLLTYLQSQPTTWSCNDGCEENEHNECRRENCCDNLSAQLQAYYIAQASIAINITNKQFTGYIYKICNGIVYLVDDLSSPTVINAIPVCKILSYQPK